MQKLVIALAALAAIGFSGAAFAEEATTGAWTTTTGPATMTDSEMDGVTAGASLSVTGLGNTGAGIVILGNGQEGVPSDATGVHAAQGLNKGGPLSADPAGP